MAKNYPKRFKQAAQIVLKGSVYSSEKRDVPAVTTEDIAEAKVFFPMEKFFIFGHARSGTTLLTRLVRVHPKVHCNYQAHFFTRSPLLESLVDDEGIGLWLACRSNRWNQGRDLSPLILRVVSDFIMESDARRAGKGGTDCIVGDKSPNSLLDGEAVHNMIKVYPDARLVFIVRDGRDAALSHRFQAFIDNPQSLSGEDIRIRQDFADNPEPYLKGNKSLFTPKGLRQMAAGWVHNIKETSQAASQLLGSNYYHLRYEDLLADPFYEMSALWDFLKVDPSKPDLDKKLDEELNLNPDADWQRKKAGEIAEAVEKGKSGSWRQMYTSRDQEIFWETAGRVLSSWGYDESS